MLYKNLTSDLSRAPSSEASQNIVLEIMDTTERYNASKQINMGENYWQFMAENYLSESIYSKAMDKKYADGASKFIGEAIKIAMVDKVK